MLNSIKITKGLITYQDKKYRPLKAHHAAN